MTIDIMKANKVFLIKASIVSLVTALTMYGCAETVRIGWDSQLVRSSEFELFIINKLQDEPKKGQYIAYHPLKNDYFDENVTFVKIIAALPGDQIVIKDGYQRINGGDPKFLHLMGTLKKKINDLDRKVTVQEGDLWMMGTTNNSYDSRYTGPIPKENIIGYAYPLF